MSVIEFPKKPAARAEEGAPERRIPASAFQPERAFRETPRQRAGRRRKPLRQDADRVSLAVTIAGHLANGRTDRLEGWGDYVAMLRRGADAARFLAEALDSVVAQEGNDETPPPTVAIGSVTCWPQSGQFNSKHGEATCQLSMANTFWVFMMSV